jgi:hypothetical protein
MEAVTVVRTCETSPERMKSPRPAKTHIFTAYKPSGKPCWVDSLINFKHACENASFHARSDLYTTTSILFHLPWREIKQNPPGDARVLLIKLADWTPIFGVLAYILLDDDHTARIAPCTFAPHEKSNKIHVSHVPQTPLAPDHIKP